MKMKIGRLALAVATLSMGSMASAQSSLTLFGVMDAAVSGFTNKSRDKLGRELTANQTMMRNSGYNSSRLGFRGTEDLGGGLAAGFWLEGQLNNDDGTGTAVGGGLAYQRRSTLSLSGIFGEVRLGRDYTPTFWNDSAADPWNQVGGGSSLMSPALGLVPPGNGFASNQNYARANNSIGYFLPPGLGGVYGQLMHVFNENTKYDPGIITPPGLNGSGVLNAGQVAASRGGSYDGGRLGFNKGPLDIAIAYGQSTLADHYYNGTTDMVKIANLAAIYDFDVAKLSAEISRSKYERDYAFAPAGARVTNVDVEGFLIGLTIPVGAGLIRAAYSRVTYDLNLTQPSFALPMSKPRASKLALGYIYNLSKRTALYATLSRVNNENGASIVVNGGPAFNNNATFTPQTSTGYDLGMRFAF